jgi:hypothetical protein
VGWCGGPEAKGGIVPNVIRSKGPPCENKCTIRQGKVVSPRCKNMAYSEDGIRNKRIEQYELAKIPCFIPVSRILSL